jgi:hypothetical protein
MRYEHSSEAPGNWKARCHESGPAGLGRGRWKRAGVSQYLAGGLLHQHVDKAVKKVLGRWAKKAEGK